MGNNICVKPIGAPSGLDLKLNGWGSDEDVTFGTCSYEYEVERVHTEIAPRPMGVSIK